MANKRPNSVPDTGHCPLLKRGCIGEACTFWIKIWGQKDGGEPVLDEECAIVWNVLLQKETLVETARVTAGHDKAANQVNLLGQIVAQSGKVNPLPQ